MKKLLSYCSFFFLLGLLALSVQSPSQAQRTLYYLCEWWEDGVKTGITPCNPIFFGDGYIGEITYLINGQIETISRNDLGWSVGRKNKECLRSEPGEVDYIAICVIKDSFRE